MSWVQARHQRAGFGVPGSLPENFAVASAIFSCQQWQ